MTVRVCKTSLYTSYVLEAYSLYVNARSLSDRQIPHLMSLIHGTGRLARIIHIRGDKKRTEAQADEDP